jgi:hypothetical protein
MICGRATIEASFSFLNKKEKEASIVALPHIIDHYIRHHKTLESELSIKRLIALLDEVE